MTDNETIKALECCTSESIEDCQVCPYAVDTIYCKQMQLSADALDLINRQQEEINTLKTKLFCISNDRDRIKKLLNMVSTDMREGTRRLTKEENRKFWAMTDEEIREFWEQLYNYTVPENVKQIIPANMLLKLGHVSKSTIDLLKRHHADNEDLTERLNATIAGQETLQKALAEKDREVAELNSDLKLLRNDYDHLKKNLDETIEKNKRLRDKVVRLTVEKDQLIKTFGECQAEAVKDFSKAVMDGLADGKIIIMSDMVGFTHDYLKEKEMGDKE